MIITTNYKLIACDLDGTRLGSDMSIAEIAGLGLATSNSCEELKAVADGVICSNDEHVAACVMERYFLLEFLKNYIKMLDKLNVSVYNV